MGGTRSLRADVRVVAATNRDLPGSISRQAFREDLNYRLNVFQIQIAPLRDRREDIVPLAEAFLEDLGRTMGRPAAGISKDGREWLLSYPWPGNVRELRNAIERAILLCDGGLVTRDHLPASAAWKSTTSLPVATSLPAGDPAPPGISAPPPSDPMTVEEMEGSLVAKALERSRGNKSKAAQLLGLTRAQLYWRLTKYGILESTRASSRPEPGSPSPFS